MEHGVPDIFDDIAKDINMEYVLFSTSHLTDTNKWFYLPQFVEYILSSVVGSDQNSTIPSIYCNSCDQCVNPSKVQSSEKHEEDFSDMWLLDSGASSHFTSDIKDFVEYHDFPSPHYTQTANGKAPIIGHGTVLIS